MQGDKFRSNRERVKRTVDVTGIAHPSTEDAEQAAKAQARAEKKRRKGRERERARSIATSLEAASDAEDSSTQKKDAEKPRIDLRRVERMSPKKQKKQKRDRLTESPRIEDATTLEQSKNGPKVSEGVEVRTPLLFDRRHTIRGRNIQAKKMAFADMKTLDQVCKHWSCIGLTNLVAS